MANIRQYIGARYVIKIYENSTDPSSAEWEQGNFEPLVMVTWQNGSYLSKKDVPASVGNPADNPTYWVQTGFYNGQIAALQAQIDAVNAAINTINNTTIPNVNANIDAVAASDIFNDEHYIMTLGDSYFDDTDKTIPNVIADYFGKTLGTNMFDFSGGGLGFIAPQVGYLHSNWLPNHVLNALTDDQKAKIKTIILGYGANDCRDGSLSTWSDFIQSVNDVASDLATNFPNAKVYCAFTCTGWYYSQAIRMLFETLYQNRSITVGWIFLGNVGNACRMGTNAQLVDSDGIHPTTGGRSYMAKAIINSLMNGQILNNWRYAPSVATSIVASCANDMVHFDFVERKTYTQATNIVFDTTGITANGNNPILTITDAGLSINGQSDYLLMIADTKIMIQTSAGYNYCDCIVRVYGNGVITFSPVSLVNNAYETITPLSNGGITVSPWSAQVSIGRC